MQLDSIHQMLIGCIVFLASVVGYLYRIQAARAAKVEDDLRRSDAMVDELNFQIRKMLERNA